MKQKAVEWFSDEISEIIGKIPLSQEQEKKLINTLEQAKEMEKQQQDELAIAFAEWSLNSLLNGEEPKAETIEGLLEIFKKEKGL